MGQRSCCGYSAIFLNSHNPSSLAEVIGVDGLTRSINVDDRGISKDAQVIGYPGDQRGAAFVSNQVGERKPAL
jgi:hypothetical protein